MGMIKRCIVLSMGIFIGLLPLHAIPPSLPGEIQVKADSWTGIIDKKQKKLVIPFTISVNEELKECEIMGIAQYTSPKGKTEEKEVLYEKKKMMKIGVHEFSIQFKPPVYGKVSIFIYFIGKDSFQNESRDKMEIIVTIRADGSYSAVTKREVFLEKQRKKIKEYEAALARNPDDPDIRLLAEKTKTLEPAMIEKIEYYNIKEELQGISGPADLKADIRSFFIPYESVLKSSRDRITFTGKVTYKKWNDADTPVPLINATIDFFDDDFGRDEHLGSVVTDWQGNWIFSCDNNDGIGQGGRDIYIILKLENEHLSLRNPEYIDEVYTYQIGDIREEIDATGGIVIDTGPYTPTDGHEPCRIWNLLVLARNHAVSVGQQDIGFVKINYPEKKSMWNVVFQQIELTYECHMEADSVGHEYGHSLMSRLGGDPSWGGAHMLHQCEQDKALAWSEGWASAFSVSINMDNVYSQGTKGGRVGVDIENFIAYCTSGEQNEGRIVAMLYDLMDTSDDGHTGDNMYQGRPGYKDANSGNPVPLSFLLGLIAERKYDDIQDFWNVLYQRLPANQRAQALEIYHYNWMPVIEQTPEPAPTTTTPPPEKVTVFLTKIILTDETDPEWGEDDVYIEFKIKHGTNPPVEVTIPKDGTYELDESEFVEEEHLIYTTNNAGDFITIIAKVYDSDIGFDDLIGEGTVTLYKTNNYYRGTSKRLICDEPDPSDGIVELIIKVE